MKTQLLLFLFLLLSFNAVFGQLCGTPHPTNLTIYPQEDNFTKQSEISKRESSSAICINVFFHIVRNTDGTNRFPMPNTDDIITELNEFYSPHNIVINNLGTNFINNSNFLQIDQGEHTTLMNSGFDVTNAINYYIVDELWDVFEDGVLVGSVTGVADAIPSDSFIVRNDRVLLPTSHHELGHCLNLYHTFQGTDPTTIGCAEAIDGSNCETCGDVVCDTPADSNAGNTAGFTPDLTNIMSYYNSRDHFTDGQGFRMRYAINSESVLNNIRSTSCTQISEIATICYSQTSTVNLTNLGGATTVWTSSSNVQIVSSNNSSATIKALNSYSNGNGWIRADLSNGIIFQEEFHVGKAEISNVIFRNNGAGVTGYFCTSHYYNEFEILPYVPDSSYEIRIRDLSTYNIVAGPYNFTGNIANLPTNFNYSPGWYLFEVRGTNSCGVSSWIQREVEFVDCSVGGGGELEYVVFPNPSSEILYVKKNIPTKNGSSEKPSDENRKNAFEIFDFNSNLIFKGIIGNQNGIDVSNYKKGNYFLRIYTNGNYETHQIIIK
ncbi:zinc-dependent metalloprotease [Salegentibacter maritimus]|uniref:zinc-dependent metalloprotease n=1 Tax=Salegentibacter maritimus TaxID=2794347 RepID=UPI0018E4B4C5|nr:zinc-dependent metalloprotease [Salegentibacter maritimus]MBI6117260.1 zinc-dependent metalloprotease [Salegentibacter maritimus]